MDLRLLRYHVDLCCLVGTLWTYVCTVATGHLDLLVPRGLPDSLYRLVWFYILAAM